MLADAGCRFSRRRHITLILIPPRHASCLRELPIDDFAIPCCQLPPADCQPPFIAAAIAINIFTLISLPHRLQPIAFRYIIFFAIIAAFR
jgi:hypothetical protein